MTSNCHNLLTFRWWKFPFLVCGSVSAAIRKTLVMSPEKAKLEHQGPNSPTFSVAPKLQHHYDLDGRLLTGHYQLSTLFLTRRLPKSAPVGESSFLLRCEAATLQVYNFSSLPAGEQSSVGLSSTLAYHKHNCTQQKYDSKKIF